MSRVVLFCEECGRVWKCMWLTTAISTLRGQLTVGCLIREHGRQLGFKSIPVIMSYRLTENWALSGRTVCGIVICSALQVSVYYQTIPGHLIICCTQAVFQSFSFISSQVKGSQIFQKLRSHLTILGPTKRHRARVLRAHHYYTSPWKASLLCGLAPGICAPLLSLYTVIEFSLSGSSPYTSTDKTKNKCT
jgi:hypothetical protein